MGLSPHLLATFYPVNYDGSPDPRGGSEVSAPLVGDASLEIALNWQSPFEASGADTRAPALTAMLQSGAIAPVINAVRDAVMGSGMPGADKTQSGFDKAAETAKELQGRTGITKLNSTQIFSGMQPIKIPVTAVFRAYRNPMNEVVKPVMQLLKWALPKALAEDSPLVGMLKTASDGKKNEVMDYLRLLLPSEAPQLIGFKYKTWSISPMVIESISVPLLSPVDSNGNYTELSIPMTICTLTALDKSDLAKITGGK
jgi:hypothetical protein